MPQRWPPKLIFQCHFPIGFLRIVLAVDPLLDNIPAPGQQEPFGSLTPQNLAQSLAQSRSPINIYPVKDFLGATPFSEIR